MEGVVEIAYRPEDEIFMISYRPGMLSVEAIFTAIRALGIQRGQNYEPGIEWDRSNEGT
ncbi:MAG: hypothetical protein JRI22_16920 [Deltaproteobacteria bacterium]|nr:hypothetical protein [Deltaproteobacteria bacterium]